MPLSVWANEALVRTRRCNIRVQISIFSPHIHHQSQYLFNLLSILIFFCLTFQSHSFDSVCAWRFRSFYFLIFSAIFKLISEINGLFRYQTSRINEVWPHFERKLRTNSTKVAVFSAVCIVSINKIAKILIITFESIVDDESYSVSIPFYSDDWYSLKRNRYT